MPDGDDTTDDVVIRCRRLISGGRAADAVEFLRSQPGLPVERRLRTDLAGDLTGWAEFRIEPVGAAKSAVSYRQEVEITAPFLGRLAPALGPLLRANHSAMMRSCERGMARVLERPLG